MDELTLGLQLASPKGPLGTQLDIDKYEPGKYELGNFYKYSNDAGIWQIVEDHVVRSMCQNIILAWNKNLANMGSYNQVEASYQKLEGAKNIAKDRLNSANPKFFSESPKGAAFTNGFLALKDNGLTELRSHTPSNAVRMINPYPYAETATPNWDAMLLAVFNGDKDIDDKIKLIHEFVGASLLGIAPRFGKCLIFFGGGSNGKSSIQNVITELFAPESVTTSNPQTWNREYDRFELVGKKLNITSELPEREMMESEAFKSIAEGASIVARQIYQKPIRYKPEAGHLFAANSLMKTNDLSQGFFRRFLIITFNNRFEATSKDIIGPIIQSELSGIATKCINALENALVRGHLTVPKSSITVGEEWKIQANPVAAFLDRCTEPSQETVKSTDLWYCWVAWCEEFKFNPTNLTNFGKRLTIVLGETAKVHKRDGAHYHLKFTEEAHRVMSLRPRLI